MKVSIISSIFAVSALLVVSVRSDSYYTNPWNILPKTNDWGYILSSFESRDQIPAYVGIYVQPFRELQAAERRDNISNIAIKDSVIALLSMGQRSINDFNVTKESFVSRDKRAFKGALLKAMDPFRGTDDDRLFPVFSRRAAGQFFYQRFDDMLVTSKEYSDFTGRRKDFARFLRMAEVQMKQWDAHDFAFLVPRNLDFELIEKYSAKVIKARYGNYTFTDKDIRDLRYKLYSLGNDANVGFVSTTVFLIAALSSAFILLP